MTNHTHNRSMSSQPSAARPDDAHDHPHGHEHGHEHELDYHEHRPGNAILTFLKHLLPLHSHTHVTSDIALESSEKGIRAVKISLLLLSATAAFQVAVVIASGSVALLADTIHNFTDTLTALPLWLAFALSRRPASRRFTHGYGRSEDLAGVVIVLIILASALVAGYESYRRILDPTPLNNIEWVMAAAILGFIGNEAVAVFRMRVGLEIGSAALVADGHHARVDGLTSLAVLGGAVGVLAGAPIADPIVGAVITVAILFITRDAAVMVWHRLMDAVDPDLVTQLEQAAKIAIVEHEGAREINGMRVRWLGHKLQAELNLVVDEELSTRESHRLSEHVRYELFRTFGHLSNVIIHVDPDGHGGGDPHELTVRR